jgi:hypothetical protein
MIVKRILNIINWFWKSTDMAFNKSSITDDPRLLHAGKMSGMNESDCPMGCF